jgi:hypothetical protein
MVETRETPRPPPQGSSGRRGGRLDGRAPRSVYCLAMKKKLLLPCLALGVAVLGLSSCDKANPVAPAGTVLSVTANPTQISTNGSSQIRVVALKPNGTPVNPGTQVRLSTNLGTIDPIVEVGDGGVAATTLTGDGRLGTATVTATVGADTSASVEVQVGRAAANVSLQASPGQVGTEGGSIDLLAVIRDSTGEPLADAAVNFQSEVGTLTSRGAVTRSDANGLARDRLVVSASDLQAISNQNSFTVRAVVGTGSGGTTEDSVEIRINRCEPVASFSATPGSNQTVTLSNTTTGEEPLNFLWDFGGQIEQQGVETSRNPGTVRYVQPGQKNITLRVENACGTSFASQTVNPQP